MQLRTQTDYAIRVMIYLADKPAGASNKELSSELGIANNYLPKVTLRLRSAGWITSNVGVHGGYRISVDPAAVSLLDVMGAMEDTVKMNRCLEPDSFCSRNAAETCPVHRIYKVYQKFSEQFFSHVTIADLLSPNKIDGSYEAILSDIEREFGSIKGKKAAKETFDSLASV